MCQAVRAVSLGRLSLAIDKFMKCLLGGGGRQSDIADTERVGVAFQNC